MMSTYIRRYIACKWTILIGCKKVKQNKTPVHTKEEENGHTNELPENQKMRPMVNIRIKVRIMLIQLYRRHGGQEMRRKP